VGINSCLNVIIFVVIDVSAVFHYECVHCSLFCPHADHLILPSFPTRRSSDLGRAAESPERLRRAGKPPSWSPQPALRRCRPAVRSEEHTSELQSRENLVCRLLLEKKKKFAFAQITSQFHFLI